MQQVLNFVLTRPLRVRKFQLPDGRLLDIGVPVSLQKGWYQFSYNDRDGKWGIFEVQSDFKK